MSQEQQEKIAEPVTTEAVAEVQELPVQPAEATVSDASETVQDVVETETPEAPVKKRVKKKGKLVSVDEIMPKPSYWPLGLAFAVAMLLFGLVSNPIMLSIGVVLVIAAVLGWTLERR